MRGNRGRVAAFLAGVALGTLEPVSAVAQDSGGAVALDTVTVSSTRTDEAAVDALAGVSVVTTEETERLQPQRISDLLRAVPGIAVMEAADSPAAAINIRGLQDFGRVAVTIDGARQNFQASGHSLGGGAFYFEPEFMSETTLVRGPVANVYGSGAIGGVVSFETKSASTFLDDDEAWAAETMARYSTNNGFALGATAARRFSDTFNALGSIVYRRNWNYEDGDGNEIFNSANEILSALLKAEFEPSDGHKLTTSFVTNNDRYDSGDPTTTNYDNKVSDNTLALRYEFDDPDSDWFDLSAGFYWTNTDLDQEYLTGANAGQTRNFLINTLGFDIYNTSRLDTGPLRHAVTVGVDGFRDLVDVDDPVGTGDLYTPGGQRLAYGGFIQDTITYGSWLEVIGGLRYDGYELSGGGTEASGNHLSPKITVGISPFETTSLHGLQLYSTYAEGYRAPSVTETLIGGIHPFPAFTFLPNPDLKPETARTFEIGLNVKRDAIFTGNDRLRLKAAWFRNDVDDFIDIVGVGPFNPACFGPCFYQYQNIASARIEGVELEAAYDAGWVFASVAGQHQRGDDRTNGEPLASVPADKLVTTLGFRALENKASFGVQWEAVAAQDRVPAGVTPSKSYNLVNLFATYQATDNLYFGLAVDNLFNQDYTPYLYSDAGPGTAVKFTMKARLGG